MRDYGTLVEVYLLVSLEGGKDGDVRGVSGTAPQDVGMDDYMHWEQDMREFRCHSHTLNVA